jgi:hypothetical protein
MNESEEERARRVAEMAARGGVPRAVTDPVTTDEIAAARAVALGNASWDSRLSPDEAWVRWHELNLRADRVMMAQIESMIPSASGAELRTLRRRLWEYRERVLRSLRETGRLGEYLHLAPPRKRRALQRGLDAIERSDDAWCECEDDQVHIDGVRYRPSRFVVRKRVFSPKHKRRVYFVECVKCGFLNITPQLPDRYGAQMYSGKGDRALHG